MEERISQKPMTYEAGTYHVAVVGAGHAGIEAALACARLGLRTLVLHHQPGRGGQHALQPRHRRHGQGPPGPGAGRPGGRDGQGRRPGLHPVPAAQPGQGPCGPVPPGPGGPAGIPEDYEAHPGAPGEPVGEAGARWWTLLTDGGAVSRGVQTDTGAAYRVQAAVICSPGPTWGDSTIVGDVVQMDSGPGRHGCRHSASQRACGRLGLTLRRFKTGTPPRVNARSVDFSQMELSAGGRGWPCPSPSRPRRPPENRAVLLAHLYQREHPRTSSGPTWTAPPCTPGPSRGWVPGTAPPSRTKVVRFPDKPRHQLFRGAHGAGHGGAVHPGVLLLPAGGGADGDAPHHARSGAGGDDPVRPTPSSMTAWTPPSCSPPWRAKRCPAFTARGSSTAPPAMRRRRSRALWPG